MKTIIHWGWPTPEPPCKILRRRRVQFDPWRLPWLGEGLHYEVVGIFISIAVPSSHHVSSQSATDRLTAPSDKPTNIYDRLSVFPRIHLTPIWLDEFEVRPLTFRNRTCVLSTIVGSRNVIAIFPGKDTWTLPLPITHSRSHSTDPHG